MASPSPMASPSVRVLVLEDDVECAEAFIVALQRGGFLVDAVVDGREALRHLLEQTYCVVVADATTPGLSGLELLRSIRAHDLDVAVVLVSKEKDFAAATEALGYGARPLLAKPIAPSRLLAEVRRASKLHELSVRQRQAMRLLAVEQAEQTYRQELNEAVDRGLRSLRMVYQPIVRADGSLLGYEALLRTGEPRFKTPLEFIDAVEMLGRLKEMGRACRASAVKGFVDAPNDALLFVNLHVYDLLDEELVDRNSPLAGVASRVVLELTERASLDRVPDMHERIGALRAMGFRVAIDDLGSGYSGLNSVVQIEPEFVKLDMTLVRDAHRSQIKRRMISLIINTCCDLGIMVIAEGVETHEEEQTLVEVGCPCFQGYLFGRPGPLQQQHQPAQETSAASKERPISGLYSHVSQRKAAND